MSLPYEKATAGDQALVALQRSLAAFGCQSFGTMIDDEHQEVIVAFRWRNRDVQLRASWKGYAAAWSKHHPYQRQYTRSKADYDAKALKQARTSVCSALRDWAKGQIVAVECGIMSFEAAFMPHMLLPSGERVVDRVEKMQLLEQPADSNVVSLPRP